ncbi:urate hydroxylase PuuD [Hyphococcus sp.]|uniref:urate hydroxylase PuuD n=1 Tax=Hyphococcus sp. TaxID=2038636 RepID=UPI00208CB76D|nr:MAG: cysteine desulfurase [Marinicaulis sp.]
MDLHLTDWLNLIFRWAHIVAGIGWIGASFYFMALDYSLRRREGMPDDVKGESWSVHGGGFYHVQKYMVAPEKMPDDLRWFQWESYATWLTGFALMSVVYYWQADIYLIDRTVLALTKMQAIGISIAVLMASWLIYDALCKSPLKDNQPAMFAVLFALIVGAAIGLGELFSARAVFLHIGAMIGSIMTGNVFFVIIPNQKIVVADLKQGKTPDPSFGKIAKLRSTHNNYLTLPVLFLMVSNHYPMTFSHPANWVVIALILPIGAIIRHYFNAHDSGKHGMAVRWQWPAAAALLFVLMVFISGKPVGEIAIHEKMKPQNNAQSQNDLDNKAFAIIQTRCAVCHSAHPADYVSAAPGGVEYDTPALIRQYAPQIRAQAVTSHAMPPGNLTEMTDEERATLGAWIDLVSKDTP